MARTQELQDPVIVSLRMEKPISMLLGDLTKDSNVQKAVRGRLGEIRSKLKSERSVRIGRADVVAFLVLMAKENLR